MGGREWKGREGWREGMEGLREGGNGREGHRTTITNSTEILEITVISHYFLLVTQRDPGKHRGERK